MLYLLIGTTMWSYLSAVFDVVAETIAWERWEGTIEYTLMAPVPRASAPARVRAFSRSRTPSCARAILFVVVALIFGDRPRAGERASPR